MPLNLKSPFLALIAGLLLSTIVAAQQSESAFYESYQPYEYGGGEISTDIIEDRYGNVFVANVSGLLKFDGKDWIHMPQTGQASYLTAVTIDDHDRIWISGAQSIGYYTATEIGQYHYTDLTANLIGSPQGKNLGTFWKLYSKGKFIYLVTSESVLRWDGVDWKKWDFDSDSRILPSFLNNQLYIHARGTALFTLNGDRFDIVCAEMPEIISGIISVVEESSSGLLCATVSNGFFYLKDGNVTPFEVNFGRPKIIHARKITGGRIAISTVKEGTLIVDHSGRLQSKANFSDSPTYDTYESRTGCLWSAATGAILKIPNIGLTYFKDNVYDICRFSGEIFYSNGKTLSNIDESEPIAFTHSVYDTAAIWDIQKTAYGLLFGSSSELGLVNHSKNILTKPSPRHITKLELSRRNPDILYTNDPPAISRWKWTGEDWDDQSSLDNFITSALSFVELSEDQLLVSSENKPLTLIDWPVPSSLQGESSVNQQILGKKEGLPDHLIWAHCLRSGDQVIIITNKGLYLYNRNTGTFQYDSTLGTNLGTDAYSLEYCEYPDEQASWVIRLPSAAPNDVKIGLLSIDQNFSVNWKTWLLPSLGAAGDINALLYEQHNDRELLWVGGSKKLLKYDLSTLPDSLNPPPNINEILETSQNRIFHSGARAPQAGYTWMYPVNTLQISYASPATTLQTKGYETRLIGFNNSWSQMSPSTSRDYTNLSPGEYVFQVRSIDEFDRRGPPATFAFEILPPWYQTKYAYAAYLAIFVTMLYAAFSLNSHRLKARNLNLEKLINQRTYDLEKQKLELVRANKTKQNFLASMSHEIRNPLNGILGIAKLLSENGDSDAEKHKERISHLIACSNHLHQLIGQTLDYSSLEAGKISARTEKFSPNKLLNDVIDIQKDLADQKGLSLILEAPEIKRDWKGDPVLLRQVLINLVSNGIKYTSEGSVKLLLKYTESDYSVEAHFEVIDTGPGIPIEKQTDVFQEFTRLQDSIDRQIPGTGLGLTIALEMTRLMGGTLTLDPDYTGGTRFILTLELGVDWLSKKNRVSEVQTTQTVLKKKHILIADDMDFNRYISSEILRSLGATVEYAENGIEALEKLRKTHFDVAILDINMPKMSGPKAVKIIQSEQTDQPLNTIFIALSAYDRPETKKICKEAGFNYFLEKPLNPDLLIKLLNESKAINENKDDEDPLVFLSRNGGKPLDQLRAELKDSFDQELSQLAIAVNNADISKQRESIHKLLGLCCLHRNQTIRDQLEKISSSTKQETDATEQNRLIQELRDLLDHEFQDL